MSATYLFKVPQNRTRILAGTGEGAHETDLESKYDFPW